MQELIDLIAGRTKTHTFKHGSLQVVMRTLKEKELDEIYRVIGTKATTEVGADLLRRRYVLANAIVSINGLPLSSFTEVQKLLSENKEIDMTEAIVQILSEASPQSLSVLWTCYIELATLAEKEKDELKKGLVDSLLSTISSGKSTKKQDL